ncbi:site-specific integrase [Amycolatopsis sp. DSM 110486]|uniref:tyrosine-type recombinase/integrase n=1 Tax=Amycolatopsis sp. DSM 110486 TaxID=2865832 RepID=UPI001C6A047D|nr:site-specific integrase [Amycolatopsis sp. DSM 110486]QYN18742.1 site-specific integrase [Amycolatopsis sp. DSM 110486]
MAEAGDEAVGAAPVSICCDGGDDQPDHAEASPRAQYEPRTIRHSNAVVRSYYTYWIDLGEGPLINPVQLDQRGRSGTWPRPTELGQPRGRLRYNPKVPRHRPRALSDEQWRQVFTALRSHRDRALLALAVSCAARAQEALGLRGVDVDWGEQLVRVVRKGSRAEQWLPASAEFFVWLRLYLAELQTPLLPQDALWWTRRRRDHGDGLQRQPLRYDALRAVFRRVNTELGTNWTMHDLRHTAALRMAGDTSLSLIDVQTILGHAHLSTTADVYLIQEEAQVINRVREHLDERRQRSVAAPPAPACEYRANDLEILFETGLS